MFEKFIDVNVYCSSKLVNEYQCYILQSSKRWEEGPGIKWNAIELVTMKDIDFRNFLL